MKTLRFLHLRRAGYEFDDFDSEERNACARCNAELGSMETYRDYRVCPACGHHYLISAHQLIKSLADERSFKEIDSTLASADPLRFSDDERYADHLNQLRTSLRLSDSIITGSATIEGLHVVLAVIDFRFMGGTMGVVLGEKLRRAADLSIKRRCPLVTIVSSGGARMQEGMFALAQMAKTASSIQRLHAAGLLYISVLTNPTTGGVLASFANLADIILAEPDALIGFAGPRVVEEVIGEPLPPDSHSAEFQLRHGLVDEIVARPDLRKRLADILRVSSPGVSAKQSNKNRRVKEAPDVIASPPWDRVQEVRSDLRPTTLDYLPLLFDMTFEIHGDRQGHDDPAFVAGFATLQGIPLVFSGFERGHGDDREFRRFGRPLPSGYRKVQRAMRLAERLDLPFVSFVDTPGAYPGVEAERSGLSAAVAETIALASHLKTPTIAIVIGEGGSGGALALSVADAVFIQERAVFSVISPEAAAAILYRDSSRAAELANKFRLTAQELLKDGFVHGVISEPPGGSHLDLQLAADEISLALVQALKRLKKKKPARLVAARMERIDHFGQNEVQNRKRS
ncbi:hypothetical protein BH23CHL5_BH23CHL5_22240 [soil metagenome]